MAQINVGRVKGPPGVPGPGFDLGPELAENLEQLTTVVQQITNNVAQKINSSEKGSVSGVATLDEAGKVPAAQLPGYVDDVLEFANTQAFPTTGESGKIYIAKNTNKTYRWGGTSYVPIDGGLALGQTAETAYPGNLGKASSDTLLQVQDALQSLSSALGLAVTAISQKVSLDVIGEPGGIPSLGEDGKVPTYQLPLAALGGGGGGSNPFGFEVRADGHLWMVVQDGTTPPEAWITSDGHLHLKFKDEGD